MSETAKHPTGRKPTYYVEAFGETKSLADWSRDHRCKVKYQLLYKRLVAWEWEPELAIVSPLRPVPPGRKPVKQATDASEDVSTPPLEAKA